MTLNAETLSRRLANLMPDHDSPPRRALLQAAVERLVDIEQHPRCYPTANPLWVTIRSSTTPDPDCLDEVLAASTQDAREAAVTGLDALPNEHLIQLGEEPAVLVQGLWRADALRSAAIFHDLKGATLPAALPGFAVRELNDGAGRLRVVLLTPGGAAERFEGTLQDLLVALAPVVMALKNAPAAPATGKGDTP